VTFAHEHVGEPRPFELVCRADDPEWHRERATGIGASEAAALIGLSPWKSLVQLYAEKTGAIHPPDLTGNDAVFWGTRLESVVRDVFAERTGRFLDKGGVMLRSTRYPWALATLDAWCSDRELGPYWPLEIKTTNAARGEDWVDGPPPTYLAQVHWQMIVTGCDRATIACLIGGQQFVWADVERDEILTRKLIHAGEEFWQRVRAGTPPPPDGSAATRAALGALYPQDSGETLVLPAALADAVATIDEVRAQAKALDARKIRAENELKVALGAATEGVLPDGTKVRWKRQTRKGYQVAESSTRVLTISKPKR